MSDKKCRRVHTFFGASTAEKRCSVTHFEWGVPPGARTRGMLGAHAAVGVSILDLEFAIPL